METKNLEFDPANVLTAAMATHPPEDEKVWENYHQIAKIAQKAGVPPAQKLCMISVEDIMIAAAAENLNDQITVKNFPAIVRTAKRYIEGLTEGWSEALVSAIEETGLYLVRVLRPWK